MSEQPIMSAEMPGARIVGSRTELVAPRTLPVRDLGVGAFRVGTGLGGLPELVGPRGEGCGLFANEQLAHATARRLSS